MFYTFGYVRLTLSYDYLCQISAMWPEKINFVTLSLFKLSKAIFCRFRAGAVFVVLSPAWYGFVWFKVSVASPPPPPPKLSAEIKVKVWAQPPISGINWQGGATPHLKTIIPLLGKCHVGSPHLTTIIPLLGKCHESSHPTLHNYNPPAGEMSWELSHHLTQL